MSWYNSSFRKILIIQTASIGDVILVTPVIEKLHANYPDARIDMVVKDGIEQVLKGHPHIHTIMAWDKTENKYNNFFKILRIIRQNKYDLVVNLQRFYATGLLTVFSGAKTVGFNKNPLSPFFSRRIAHLIGKKHKDTHEIDRNLALLNFLNDDKRYLPKLYPGKKAYARISQYRTSNYITISPASIWYTKQFPVEKWIDFINQVSSDYTIYLLGAESDREISQSIMKNTRHSKLMDLCGRLSLLESAALIGGAHMNYVNDSAAQHLASAMNAPVTTVYCSTVPEFGFGPLSEDRGVIETDHQLDCRPCGLHGYQQCPEGHFKCADIDITKLLKRLEQ